LAEPPTGTGPHPPPASDSAPARFHAFTGTANAGSPPISFAFASLIRQDLKCGLKLPKAGCVPLSHHIPLLRCMRSLLDKPQLLYGWWTEITSRCAPQVQCPPASTKRLR